MESKITINFETKTEQKINYPPNFSVLPGYTHVGEQFLFYMFSLILTICFWLSFLGGHFLLFGVPMAYFLNLDKFQKMFFGLLLKMNKFYICASFSLFFTYFNGRFGLFGLLM